MHFTDKRHLSEELHYFHQLSGYTMRQLAERARLPLDTIRAIEAGTPPTDTQAAVLMTLLGITETDLRTRTQRRPKASF